MMRSTVLPRDEVRWTVLTPWYHQVELRLREISLLLRRARRMLQVQIVVMDVRRSQLQIHRKKRDVRRRWCAGSITKDRYIWPKWNRVSWTEGYIKDSQTGQRICSWTSWPAILETLQQKVIL